MRQTVITAACLLYFAVRFGDAQATVPSVLAEIQRQLASAPALAYDYTIEQRLPDGSRNILKGKMLRSGSYMCETNGAQLVLQTDDWYYKADHAGRKVFIVRAAGVRSMFRNGEQTASSLSMLPDSALIRYGNAEVKEENGIVKLTITFGREVLIRKLYLEYDRKHKIPLLYRVEMDVLHAIREGDYEEVYRTQIMTATRFSTRAQKIKDRPEDHFRYEKGKIKLTKYTHYKLITSI